MAGINWDDYSATEKALTDTGLTFQEEQQRNLEILRKIRPDLAEQAPHLFNVHPASPQQGTQQPLAPGMDTTPTAPAPGQAPVRGVAPAMPVPSSPSEAYTVSPEGIQLDEQGRPTTSPRPLARNEQAEENYQKTVLAQRGSGSRSNPDPATKELQTVLAEEGYKLSVDGVFGPDTQRALEDLQKVMGIPLSGKYDQMTHEAFAVLEAEKKEAAQAKAHQDYDKIPEGSQRTRAEFLKANMDNRDMASIVEMAKKGGEAGETFGEEDFVTYPDKTYTHWRQIKPTSVMVHHTGSSSSDVYGAVKERGFRVNYAVQPDGTVEKFMEDTVYGAHAGGGWNQGDINNYNTIGIEFVGSNDGAITQKQIDSGVRFLPYLIKKHGLNPEDVVGQMEVSTHKQAGEGARILWEYSKAEGLDRPNYFSVGSGKRLRDWVIYEDFYEKDAEKTWENWSIEKDGVTYSGWSGAQDLYDKEAETVGAALVAAGYTNDQKGMKKYLADSGVKLPSKVGAYRLSNSLAIALLSGKSKEPEKTTAVPTSPRPRPRQLPEAKSQKNLKVKLPQAKQLGMIGGVRDQNRVWQSFGSSGMAHSSDYRDYSQLFREYTTTKKRGYYEVGKTADGQTVYAAPDYYKGKDGNYMKVSKDDAVRLAEEFGSLIPQRDWVKRLYSGAIRLRMPTQPIYKTGGEGDSAKYTAAINAAIKKNKKYKKGALIVHGKEFFVSK